MIHMLTYVHMYTLTLYIIENKMQQAVMWLTLKSDTERVSFAFYFAFLSIVINFFLS